MHSVDRNAASSMGRADGRKPVKNAERDQRLSFFIAISIIVIQLSI
jgi:hypothetical protein